MLRRPSNEDDSERYLKNIDDRYFFDAATGLYQPKTCGEERNGGDEKPGSQPELRFFTDPKRDWVAITVGVLTLILVGLYTHYARKQWQEAQRTADQAVISAGAAQSAATTAGQALTASQRSLETEQRPYVVPDNVPTFVIGEDKKVSLTKATIKFKNIGHTPAFENVSGALFDRRDFTSKTRTPEGLSKAIESIFGLINREAPKFDMPEGRFALRQDLAPDANNFFITIDLSSPLPQEDVPRVFSGDTILIFAGIARYKGFGKTYTTEFCFYYFGKDPTTWHYCPAHNTIR